MRPRPGHGRCCVTCGHARADHRRGWGCLHSADGLCPCESYRPCETLAEAAGPSLHLPAVVFLTLLLVGLIVL